MKYLRHAYILVVSLTTPIWVMGQKVGVNTIDPESDLDVRSIGFDFGADLQLADPNTNFFLRLRSHTKTDAYSGIVWKSGVHLKMKKTNY